VLMKRSFKWFTTGSVLYSCKRCVWWSWLIICCEGWMRVAVAIATWVGLRDSVWNLGPFYTLLLIDFWALYSLL